MARRTVLGMALSVLGIGAKPAAAAPQTKKFALSAYQIKPLATGHGGCLATDKITVGGHEVGYMYREAPNNKLDSGWRFFAGDENDAYIDDLSHSGVYDINTIANYDPAIIPFLDAKLNSAFVRQDATFVPDPLGVPHR